MCGSEGRATLSSSINISNMTMTYRIHQNLYTYIHWKIRKYNTEADCHMSGQCLLDARKIDTGTDLRWTNIGEALKYTKRPYFLILGQK